ncbi:hypothetical protein [Thermoflexibacter ruber]|uniref:hypothetical protein n=1 Tax=Thermoflexibacter ruber TaxID=1003 RepID=UPI0015A5D9AA|nr:hypothetical protein [Thermoflexibacter ruber]
MKNNYIPPATCPYLFFVLLGVNLNYCHTVRTYIYTDFWEASLLTFLWTHRHQ